MKKKIKSRSQKDRVYDALLDGNKLTAKEIAMSVRFSDDYRKDLKNIRTYLLRLKREGRITVADKRGRSYVYASVSDDDRDFIESFKNASKVEVIKILKDVSKMNKELIEKLKQRDDAIRAMTVDGDKDKTFSTKEILNGMDAVLQWIREERKDSFTFNDVQAMSEKNEIPFKLINYILHWLNRFGTIDGNRDRFIVKRMT